MRWSAFRPHLDLLTITLKTDSNKPKAATGGTNIMEYDKDKVDEFTLALPWLMVHRYNSIV
jgi:hypothetical protein